MERKVKTALVGVLVLVTLYFWTLPIAENPFGDVDSSTHFALGDYMRQTDSPVYFLPPHLDQQYGFESNHKLWYPPQFHLDMGIVQILSNDRIVAAYLLFAILSAGFVLTSFLFINLLYGFWVAWLSSFLLAFSFRDYMYYLMGLWPQSAAYTFIPLALYCYFKYTSTHEKDEPKPQYLYVMALVFAIQFFFHAYGFFHSLAAILVYSAYLLWQRKKLPFEIKHAVIAAIVFAVLMAPFIVFPLQKAATEASTFEFQGFDRLFSWYPDYEEWGRGAYPESFWSYSKSHGIWTLPLLLLGVVFLFMRKKRQDMLMLSYLLSYYVLIHMDMFGDYGGRVGRSMGTEAQVFYPIIVLGLLAIPSLLKMPKDIRGQAKAGLMLLFVVLAIWMNALPAKDNLEAGYRGISRINNYEVEASDWIRDNTAEDSKVRVVGVLPLNVKKWIRAYSMRPAYYESASPFPTRNLTDETHMMIDYSQFAMMGRQDLLQQLQAFEFQLFNGTPPVFVGKDNLVRVYELG